MYSIKIYTDPSRTTILGGQFIGNLELFWTNQFLVSTLNLMGGILCGGIMSERSKI